MSAIVTLLSLSDALERASIEAARSMFSSNGGVPLESLHPHDSASQQLGSPPSPSQVTVTLGAPLKSKPKSAHADSTISSTSQVTMRGSAAHEVHGALKSTPPSSASVTVNNNQAVSNPRYGPLQTDSEGKETRRQMLERRRKECSVEEADVALAPVLKINVPYVFYPHQYAMFRKLFPRVNPDSGLSYVHHDHPVAHTATMVGIRYLQNCLNPGERVLDLFGNPNGNEQFNRFQSTRWRKRPTLPAPPRIDTMVDYNSPMDYVRRVTKWGPEEDDEGRLRYIRGKLDDVVPNRYSTFLMVHTLYYQTMDEICRFLNKNPQSRIMALVNYSPERAGTLYGELKFTKSDGMTTQISPNGETYRHPDIDPWFQFSSWRLDTLESETWAANNDGNRPGGISWTTQNIGGPMYVITIAAADEFLCRRHHYVMPETPTLRVGNGNIFFGWIRYGSRNVQLRITNHDLAAELRHYMTFRDRSDPDTFNSLCVKARRLTSRDLVSGAREHIVNDGDLADHIVYAYVVDAPGELELLEGVKLLRGDLLAPHSQALKFEGKDRGFSFIPGWFKDTVFGRECPPAALGSSSSTKVGIFENTKRDFTGLLPVKRR